MSREAVFGAVRNLMAAASRRDIERLLAAYAEDAVAVSPVFGVVKGRHAIAATWQTLFSTFADFSFDVSDVLVDGGRVAVLSTVETTDRIGWFGLPPTGQRIVYRLVLLFTVVDDKIVRDERIYDSTGILERLEKARLDKELRLAADVQHALLPRTMHVGPFCETVGDSLPCRAIGGDFFEFIESPSGAVAVAIGDVAGKGPAAALLAAMLQGMLTAEASSNGTPGEMLSRMNRQLAARGLGSRFATLVFGVVSPDGRFVYSNAGHNPPALLTGSRIQRLETGGPILGAFADAVFEEEVVQLRDRDTLVMFTDGVTEARSVNDEEFGEQRLMRCLNAGVDAQPVALMDRILNAVREFSQNVDQSDDVTVTVTKYGS
jgi:steroid delta-isomerase-like uncharacterized protein